MALRLPDHPLPADLVEQLVRLSAAEGRPAVMAARISEDRVGAGLGATRQIKDQIPLYNRLGLRLVGIYVDNDFSAYSGKPRPDYLVMLDALRNNVALVVTAWHTDRLHRAPIELEEYIDVCEPRGIVTHTVETGPIDLATPSGRMVARQLGAVARYESELKAARQRTKKLELAEAGKYRGGPRPYGWESDGLTERPGEFRILQEMTDRALAGEGLRTLSRELVARDERTSTGALFTPPSLRDVLLRARNAGLIERGGEVIGQAQWAAAVDEDKWRALRAMLTDPARRLAPSNAVKWLGSGVYLCGKCGDGLTTVLSGTTHSTRRSAEPYKPAYRCRAKAHMTRLAGPIDALVEDVIVERLSRPDAIELLARDTGEDLGALHAEFTALRTRLDEQVTLHAQGLIDGTQLATGSKLLRADLAGVEARISASARGSVLSGVVDLSDEVDQAVRSATLRRVWFGVAEDRSDGLPLDRRRAVVRAVATVTLLAPRPGRPPAGMEVDPDSVLIEFTG